MSAGHSIWLLLILLLCGFLLLRPKEQELRVEHIDEPDASLAASATRIKLCEKRQLSGDQHTLNPHAPPARRRQELIVVCVEVLPDGTRPNGPVLITTKRKPWSIA